MLVMLGFGSSARRGATGWTNRARVRAVIDACRPDQTIDGASPAGGADDLVHEEAVAASVRSERCPMDRAFDGPGGVAFLHRNERMYRTWRPSLAVGFISGRVGTPLSSGSAHMARTCLYGLDDVSPCPVVVYRDDGVEPYGGLVLTRRTALACAVDQMRRLFWVTRDAALVTPGKALVAFWEERTQGMDITKRREEVLTAMGRAAEVAPRWAPWIEAVCETVRRC